MNQTLMPWYTGFKQDILPDWEPPPLLDIALGDYVTQEVVTTLALVEAHRMMYRFHEYGVNQEIAESILNAFVQTKRSCVYMLANTNPKGIRFKFLKSLIGCRSGFLWNYIHQNEFVKKCRHPETGLMYIEAEPGGPTNESVCDNMLKRYQHLRNNGLELR